MVYRIVLLGPLSGPSLFARLIFSTHCGCGFRFPVLHLKGLDLLDSLPYFWWKSRLPVRLPLGFLVHTVSIVSVPPFAMRKVTARNLVASTYRRAHPSPEQEGQEPSGGTKVVSLTLSVDWLAVLLHFLLRGRGKGGGGAWTVLL